MYLCTYNTMALLIKIMVVCTLLQQYIKQKKLASQKWQCKPNVVYCKKSCWLHSDQCNSIMAKDNNLAFPCFSPTGVFGIPQYMQYRNHRLAIPSSSYPSVMHGSTLLLHRVNAINMYPQSYTHTNLLLLNTLF